MGKLVKRLWSNNTLRNIVIGVIVILIGGYLLHTLNWNGNSTETNPILEKFSTTTTIRLMGQINLNKDAVLTAVPPIQPLINRTWDPGYEIWLTLEPLQEFKDISPTKTGTSTYTTSVPFTVPDNNQPDSYDFKRDAFHNKNNILIGTKTFVVTLTNTQAIGGINPLNYLYTFDIKEQQ